MNGISSPVRASPILYPDLTDMSLFSGIKPEIVDAQPTLTNIPPATTYDTGETSGSRHTLQLLSGVQQASSECSFSGSESLPVSVNGSQTNILHPLSNASPIHSRALTPVSGI